MDEIIFEKIRSLKKHLEILHDELDKIPQMLDDGPYLASYDILTFENQGTLNPAWRDKCDEWMAAGRDFSEMVNSLNTIQTNKLLIQLKVVLDINLEYEMVKTRGEWNNSWEHKQVNEKILLEKLLYVLAERKVHEAAPLLNQFLDHDIWPIQVIKTLGTVGNEGSIERLRKKIKSNWEQEREAAWQALLGLEQNTQSHE
ncbi:MAG TPA: HEAT repeat domain-containing protein [Saprospiraceae bacterium]|nr:HEAT repeat domain-containing protein [Saprospiraceae bacterium]